MKAAAVLGVLAALLLTGGAQGQSWSGRTPYQELETTPRWQNPYSKPERSDYRERSEYRERREYGGGGGGLGLRQRGGSDITGFKREPLGGGSPWDRVR